VTGSTQTVLVVDDEPDILRLVEAILKTAGFRVVSAHDGDAALRALDLMVRPPDLVLTDVVMPGMSGPLFADQVTSRYPSLPVLFMSGYNERQIVQRYVVEKGFSLVAKPFTPQRLLSSVKATLDFRSSVRLPTGTDV
jgi:two-component system cell cycle sensor histidine kinase/response regulator CckA